MMTTPLFMIIQLCPPIYTYPPIHFRKIDKKFWIFLQILSTLLFRGKDDAIQLQYTIQAAADFDSYFLTVNILLLLAVIGQLI